MHLDRTVSHSIPPSLVKRLPVGIHVIEPSSVVGSEVEKCPYPNLPWSYLFIHHRKMDQLAARLSHDGIPFFIHRTVHYQRKRRGGVREVERPTVSGLVFLQGDSTELQRYLNDRFPSHYLVKDCSTGLPAVIPHSRMEPFMRVVDSDPSRVRFLLKPLRHYADGNTRLRIVSGFLKGFEGYIIRIDRDRRLVMDIGGMTVAISGIHGETFEVVRDNIPTAVGTSSSAETVKPSVHRALSSIQERIDASFLTPRTSSDICSIVNEIELWQERAMMYSAKGDYKTAAEILFFLIENVDYHYSNIISPDITPIMTAVHIIWSLVDRILGNEDITDDTRSMIESEKVSHQLMFGYLIGKE
ncbi:MAG: hypothetical protein Q4E63_03825 [Prevotellaceae bacterium]|nr:hypothetical protein [Prevotellaceae bacterium]